MHERRAGAVMIHHQWVVLTTSLGKLAQVMKKIHRRLMKILAEFYQPCKVSNIKTGNKAMSIDFSLISRLWRSGNETMFIDFSLISRLWRSGNETMFVDFSLISRLWRSGNETMFVDFSLISRLWRSRNETMETYCPTRALLFLLIRNKATTPSRPAVG